MIFIPLHTTTRGNSRQHWRAEAKKTKKERNDTFWALVEAENKYGPLPRWPVKVTLTRCGPRKLDRQNVPSALKAVVDGVADFYKCDDGMDEWQFVFAQRQQSLYGVEIQLEAI